MTIITAPAGSGKTEYVVRRLVEAERANFGGEFWVLLPTQLQIESFRERLLESLPLFNIRFFNFYELYNTILDLSGMPQRILSHAAGSRVLSYAIEEVKDHLTHYQRIMHTPGFHKMAGEFIRELKQGVVTLDQFQEYASTNKDRDLFLIYQRYQFFLQAHELVDRDGAGWVALQQVEKNPDVVKHVSLMIVDGYDHFDPLQARLLAAINGGVQEMLITLTYEDHRSEDACRTFARTLNRLKKLMPQSPLHSLERGRRGEATSLAHLEQHLFSLTPTAIPADNALHLIEAPDPRIEARAVMREVKRLLLTDVSPREIMITMRDTALYAEPLRVAAAAYDVPVVMRQEAEILRNPAVATIMSILTLHAQDFPRRQLLDLLWSPYITQFSPENIGILERASMERLIIGGRELWLEALKTTPKKDEEGEKSTEVPLILVDALQHFFDRITPAPEATARDYVAWIENLIGDDPSDEYDNITGLHLYDNVRNATDQSMVVRDLYALRGFNAALGEVLAAYDLISDTTNQILKITWQEFFEVLENTLKHRTIRTHHQSSRAGRVLITTVFEARGLPHDYVFVVGMSEGVFPAQQKEDQLYSDKDRIRMELAGIGVQVPAERMRDLCLFYEMCALAQKRLTLSRPTIDTGGNLWAESAYWRDVLALLKNPSHQKLLLGQPVALQEAANLREAAVSLSYALSRAQLNDHTQKVLNWLSQYPIWRNLLQGRKIEHARELRFLPFDGYSGILENPDLIAEVVRMLDRTWSATQFNELAQCGFRFFSRRLLALEPYKEPESGLDIMQRGSVNHAILEHTYHQLAAEKLPIHPDYLSRALEILHEKAAEIFATAPQDYGFRADRLWQQTQAEMLKKLITILEIDFSEKSPFAKVEGTRIPFQMETEFGTDAPFKIKLGQEEFRVRGAIDRMDVVNWRNVIVADYKSGKIPEKKDILEGRNFQMMLYLLAADQFLPDGYEISAGLFWSIQNPDKKAFVEPQELDGMPEYLYDLIVSARKGHFPNKPTKLQNGKCASYCEYSQLCRVNRASKFKEVPG